MRLDRTAQLMALVGAGVHTFFGINIQIPQGVPNWLLK